MKKLLVDTNPFWWALMAWFWISVDASSGWMNSHFTISVGRCYLTFPEIHLWCYNYWPLNCQPHTTAVLPAKVRLVGVKTMTWILTCHRYNWISCSLKVNTHWRTECTPSRSFWNCCTGHLNIVISRPRFYVKRVNIGGVRGAIGGVRQLTFF